MGKSVCVIGAGCSGLAAVKNLIQAGITKVVCFEKNDRVGGNWIYTAGASDSSVCETTHIISSKKMSEFVDFPMPDDYPDYPSHRQVLAYFESYARHFGLEQYIRFNTAVAQVEKLPDERWSVALPNGETHTFDYLLVANGHHAVPRMPELPGAFSGELLHSHDYKTNAPFAGKRVLVIGGGNSACDCAVEISRVAEFTAISMRRPQYIVPKFFMGKPTDTFNGVLVKLPKFLSGFLRQMTLRVQVGDYRQYGLEQPDFPVTGAHPTLNSELLYRIRHGSVYPRRGIELIDGNTVFFSDGKSENFDTIIAATGYKIVFPFFAKDFINYEEAERIPLYLRMIHPDHKTLFFIGLLQPQGCIWPLSDMQAKLAANIVMGRQRIPTNVRALAERDSDEIARDFLHAKRHTVEVHFQPFFNKLRKLIPPDAPEWSGG
ncbi:MAG: NAD(P)-binding domain-containing protein [Saprospiraceae bacterium]|nr:NAD(P)-binding domain-containing protein [Saprospiraceae bacterium]